MNTSELRIGNNIFNYRDEVVEVIALDTSEIATSDNGGWTHSESFRPIELSPDVLDRCGFIRRGPSSRYFDRGLLDVFLDDDGIIKFDLYRSKKISLEYLHQLQNLFQLITQTELEIK